MTAPCVYVLDANVFIEAHRRYYATISACIRFLVGEKRDGYVLTPGRCLGAGAEEDGGEPFEGRMKRLTARLWAEIRANMSELGYGV